MPSIPLSWSLGTSRTGLSLTARVRAVGSTAVTVVPMAEVADVLGDYEGTFNSPAFAATYVVQLVDADGKQYGTGSFSTDAAGNEITLAPVAAKVALLAVDEQGRVAANNASGATASEVWSYGDRRLSSPPTLNAVPTLLQRHRQIIRGDTYGPNGRAFASQASAGGEWPADLSGFSWTCTLTKDAANAMDGTETLSVAAEVVTPTGASRALSVALSAEQTAALAPGRYGYSIKGTSGDVAWSPETGDLDAL